ncbi:MAG TPA: hypothetical protein PKD64_03385 [Pirellulaceae bacterium]|nr:hypothetical protein [Pirellulaceae bacterium]HMO91213.1 hypothetical protein [Pirellulaceae bacterium]HMP70796.1 hypothetical protein [Pirellulaceae bacterium]
MIKSSSKISVVMLVEHFSRGFKGESRKHRFTCVGPAEDGRLLTAMDVRTSAKGMSNLRPALLAASSGFAGAMSNRLQTDFVDIKIWD